MGEAGKIKPRKFGVDFNVGAGYSGRKNFSTNGIPSVQSGGHLLAELRGYMAFQRAGSGVGDKFFEGYELAVKAGTVIHGFRNSTRQATLQFFAVQPSAGVEFSSTFFVDTHNVRYNFSCGPKVGAGYVADVTVGGEKRPVRHGVYLDAGAIFSFSLPHVAQRRSWGPKLELGARINLFPKAKGLHAVDWMLTLTGRF